MENKIKLQLQSYESIVKELAELVLNIRKEEKNCEIAADQIWQLKTLAKQASFVYTCNDEAECYTENQIYEMICIDDDVCNDACFNENKSLLQKISNIQMKIIGLL